MSNVTPWKLVIRCLMERVDEHQWQAFSLEFGLAVQAESERDARRKLEQMIEQYLRDALLGEDREHAYELLRRKATWSVYAKYYGCLALSHCMKPFNGRQIYCEPMPLAPCPA